MCILHGFKLRDTERVAVVFDVLRADLKEDCFSGGVQYFPEFSVFFGICPMGKYRNFGKILTKKTEKQSR